MMNQGKYTKYAAYSNSTGLDPDPELAPIISFITGEFGSIEQPLIIYDISEAANKTITAYNSITDKVVIDGSEVAIQSDWTLEECQNTDQTTTTNQPNYNSPGIGDPPVAYFDTDQYIDAPQVETAVWSLIMRFRQAVPKDYGTIFLTDSVSGEEKGFYIRIFDASDNEINMRFGLGVGNGYDDFYFNPGGVMTGWVTMGITLGSDDTVIVYENDTTQTFALTGTFALPDDSVSRIGAGANASLYALEGDISHLKVFDVTLTADQMTAEIEAIEGAFS
jgi:hypothetical protein